MAAMVNMNNILNGKDSRWLQLEVCREFQRNKCSRQDTECKFAHPPANVEVQNGKVTACYDSIKGRCNRDKPPCKYFHPPQHLKDQLLINGRNHLALKNALMQQMGIAPGQPVMPGQVSAVAPNPYLTGIPTNTYSPYFAPGHLVPALLGPDPSAVSQLGPSVPQAVQVTQPKIPRSDRLEAFSGMVPYKRPATEKSGIPVYQPGATTYQQLMLQQPPFVPVSCEYQSQYSTHSTTTTATTSCATANPQPQTSIINTTSITSATTMANISNLYAANNNLYLNIIQNTNLSNTLSNQNNYIVNSSGNNTTSTATFATSKVQGSNLISNSNLYNYNSNIISYVNNNNNNNNNNNLKSSTKTTTTLTNAETSNPFSTAINSKMNKNKDLLNANPENDSGPSIAVVALNVATEASNSCTNINIQNVSTNTQHKNDVAIHLTSATTSSQTPRYAHVNIDSVGKINYLPNSTTHKEQDKSTKITLSNDTNRDGTATTTTADVNIDTESTSSISAGILPTPVLEAPPSITAVNKAYQMSYPVHKNIQRFYGPMSLYQDGGTLYSDALGSNCDYTPATDTISSALYTPQPLTVTSPYGNIVTAVGTPAYSYASCPHNYVQSTCSGAAAGFYHDAASLAKEVAQKNYANAVKIAASNVLSGKSFTAALKCTGISLNKSYISSSPQVPTAPAHAALAMATTNPLHATLMQAHQQHAQAQHLHAATSGQTRSMSSVLPGMSTQIGTPVHTPTATPKLLQRPGYNQVTSATIMRHAPIQLSAASQSAGTASNYITAAAVAANQQYAALQQQQSFFYPGMMATSGYPYGTISTVQTMPGTISIPTMAQLAPENPAAAGNALVLNPYKKMKTS